MCTHNCLLISDVPIEVLSLFILPYIINTCHVKTGNKKKWKPKVEVAESFICRIPVNNLLLIYLKKIPQYLDIQMLHYIIFIFRRIYHN